MTPDQRETLEHHIQKLFEHANRMTGATPIQFTGDVESIEHNAKRAQVHLQFILDTLKTTK